MLGEEVAVLAPPGRVLRFSRFDRVFFHQWNRLKQAFIFVGDGTILLLAVDRSRQP
jgi:hypothetical protein